MRSNSVRCMDRGLTQEVLRARLHYDPETGIFTWLPRPSSGGRGNARGSHWNAMYAGTRAGWVVKHGYRAINLAPYGSFSEHRLAWFYVYGSWAPQDIDHINCDKADNRIENLREACRSDNSFNRPPPKSNKSGVKGVHFDRARGKWMAYIKKDWKRYHLGRFDTIEEAVAARQRADVAMNGEFARLE